MSQHVQAIFALGGGLIVLGLFASCGYDFDAPFAENATVGGAGGAGGTTGGSAGSGGGTGGKDSGPDASGGDSGAAGAAGTGVTGGTGALAGAAGSGGSEGGVGGGGTGGSGGTGGTTASGGTGGVAGAAGAGGSAGVSGAGGGTPTCAVYSDSECDTCAATNCAMQCAAVNSVPGSSGYMTCRDDCAWDGGCRSGCRQQYQQVLGPMTDLENCIYANCGMACGKLSCTEYTNGTVPTCDHCMDTKCGNECANCLDNPDCPPYWNCFVWCGEPGEADCGTCTSNFGGGLDEMAALFSTTGCLPTECSTECY